MRLRDHRYDDAPFHRFVAPLLTGIVVLTLAIAGAVALSRMVAEAGPKVGDIASFTPNSPATPDVEAELSVTRADGSPCRLDIPVLQRQGGSLVVQARSPATRRVYRIHWLGGATAAGSHDCGNDVDLDVVGGDLEVLALAAGGFGAVHRGSYPQPR